MSRAAVFARGPRRLRHAKSAMAIADMATVLGALAIALVRRHEIGASPASAVAALAVSMFVWHQLENVVCPRRLGIVGAPLYPAGRVWPHLAFTAALIASSGEWIASLAGTGIDARPALARWSFEALGIVVFAAGVALRLWAFLARGRDFLADPRDLQPPPRTGPYAFSRHPADIGALAISVGAALALGSSWGMASAITFGGAAAVYASRREAGLWNTVNARPATVLRMERGASDVSRSHAGDPP